MFRNPHSGVFYTLLRIYEVGRGYNFLGFSSSFLAIAFLIELTKKSSG